MRFGIVALLLCSGLLLDIAAGCSRVPNERDPYLATWHSSNVSLREREDAAVKLTPIGTKMAIVLKVLGEPTKREHGYGPRILPPYGMVDSWRLVYQFTDGSVVFLQFDQVSSGSDMESLLLTKVGSWRTSDVTVIDPVH